MAQQFPILPKLTAVYVRQEHSSTTPFYNRSTSKSNMLRLKPEKYEQFWYISID